MLKTSLHTKFGVSHFKYVAQVLASYILFELFEKFNFLNRDNRLQ